MYLVIIALLLGSGLIDAEEPGASRVQPAPAPHTVRTMHELTPGEASLAKPVMVIGVVTSSTEIGFFLQDHTAGTWVVWPNKRSFISGDKVEVVGVTGPGEFAPVIVAHGVRKIGRGPLPTPRPVSIGDLVTGNEDAQYVTVTGVVRAVAFRQNATAAQRVWLRLMVGNSLIYATLPEEAAKEAARLVDCTVAIDAPADSTKNSNRQITAAVLTVANLTYVKVLQRGLGDPFAVQRVPIYRLLQYRSGTSLGARVKVRGVVTYIRGGDNFVVQDGDRALVVSTFQTSSVRVGDSVEVAGFLATTNVGPELQDATIHDLGPGKLPVPTPVTSGDLASGRFNYSLVSITGELIRRIEDPSIPTLLIQDGATAFRAELDNPSQSSAFKNVRDNSRVRITGVSALTVEGSWNKGGPASSALHYVILMRSPEDVTEIGAPPWWSPKHLLYLALVLGVLLILSFGLGLYARLDNWKLGAVLKERERLAADIHDTLAQSFAGIGFQMQVIRKEIPRSMPDLLAKVDHARALVRHSHKEARRSIAAPSLEAMDSRTLVQHLDAAARQSVEESSVVIVAHCAGDTMMLEPAIVDALFHIGQEAIANAVRHGEPHHISISLNSSLRSIALTIEDDGSGFVESGDLLGFGLRGMRKRAASISADIRIDSSPGHGSRIAVTVNIPQSSLISRAGRILDILLNRTQNG